MEYLVTVRVEELALANSVTLAALLDLLEEKRVVRKDEVLARVAEMKWR